LKTWEQRVQAGDFSAIPPNIDFEHSVKLAHFIDGYELAGGHMNCSAITRRLLRRSRMGLRTGGSALDLWIAIFFAHRGYRHAGAWPEGAELMALDRLVAELRAALLALKPPEKAGIMAAMDWGYWKNVPEAGRG